VLDLAPVLSLAKESNASDKPDYVKITLWCQRVRTCTQTPVWYDRQRVIPTPGHTPGAVSVLLDSCEAIVGDMVMGKLMGLLRRPGPPIVAWDLAQNRESLRHLAALSPRLVYVGHGGPFEDLSSLIKEDAKDPGLWSLHG
jgi:glyoxylase-like metal-dependent hydrolase (beta-lactamase superfamily II)